MYTLIGATKSRPLWLLEELGVPFTHLPATPHSEQARTASASGKIPVLMVDDTAISDSTAILTYLADRHGQFTFPAGTLQRAQQDSLTQMILDELDAALWTAARHSIILPEEMRLPAIRDSLKWEFARSIDALMARFKGPFLMGEPMAVPDIIATQSGVWAMRANFPVENETFREYVARMRERAAFIAVDVTSRGVVRVFLKQLWFEFVPVFHRLQGRLAAQG